MLKNIITDKTFARITLALVMVIWGTAIVITKGVVAETGPIMLATIRFAIAAAVFVPIGLRGFPFKSLPFASLALSSFFGITLFYALLNFGLLYSSAASAGMIQGAAPIITIILSLIFLKEYLTLPKLAGVILSVAGIFCIVISTSGDFDTPQSLLGHILVVASTFSWAIYVVTSKALVERYPQAVVTAGHIGFGWLFLIPFAVFEVLFFGFGNITPTNLLIVAYLGLSSSGFAYFLWNYSMKYLNATEAGVFCNLCPLITMVTAVFFLNEPVGIAIIVGGLLIIIGLFLSGRPGKTILYRRNIN